MHIAQKTPKVRINLDLFYKMWHNRVSEKPITLLEGKLMKKLLAILLAASMLVCLFAACGEDTASDGAFDYDAIADNMTSEDGTYDIAFITDVGQLKDKSFNQGTWEGVKRYATENGCC